MKGFIQADAFEARSYPKSGGSANATGLRVIVSGVNELGVKDSVLLFDKNARDLERKIMALTPSGVSHGSMKFIIEFDTTERISNSTQRPYKTAESFVILSGAELFLQRSRFNAGQLLRKIAQETNPEVVNSMLLEYLNDFVGNKKKDNPAPQSSVENLFQQTPVEETSPVTEPNTSEVSQVPEMSVSLEVQQESQSPEVVDSIETESSAPELVEVPEAKQEVLEVKQEVLEVQEVEQEVEEVEEVEEVQEVQEVEQAKQEVLEQEPESGAVPEVHEVPQVLNVLQTVDTVSKVQEKIADVQEVEQEPTSLKDIELPEVQPEVTQPAEVDVPEVIESKPELLETSDKTGNDGTPDSTVADSKNDENKPSELSGAVAVSTESKPSVGQVANTSAAFNFKRKASGLNTGRVISVQDFETEASHGDPIVEKIENLPTNKPVESTPVVVDTKPIAVQEHVVVTPQSNVSRLAQQMLEEASTTPTLDNAYSETVAAATIQNVKPVTKAPTLSFGRR